MSVYLFGEPEAQYGALMSLWWQEMRSLASSDGIDFSEARVELIRVADQGTFIDVHRDEILVASARVGDHDQSLLALMMINGISSELTNEILQSARAI